jgi:Cytochrome c7 and related cytochrome c
MKFASSSTSGTTIAARLWRWIALALIAGVTSGAWAQSVSRDFDHLKTGFALTGTHIAQRCESCHQLGVFKGTPRDCASCHTAGTRLSRNNVVKPDKHIPTQQACDACHNTMAFTGAKFSHAGVTVGSCQTCHAAGLATGKTAGHPVTSASCDTCHRTTAWLPASGFNHAGVIAGTCATCHGVTAKGKTALHIPTTVPTSMPSCDTCHRAGYTSFLPARFHASATVSASCVTCHTGTFSRAVGKPSTPVHANATTCEVCHRSTATWTNVKVDHSGFNAATSCANCHDGRTATGKSPTHVATTAGCEVCHAAGITTRTWLGATMNHSTFTAATNCASCHSSGGGATARTLNHIPIGAANCFACHGTTVWRPTKWTHTQVPVAAQCATCHTGTYLPADGRSATHIPYASVAALGSANCDRCHVVSTVWTGAKLHAKVAVNTQCANCHTGNYTPGQRKPTNATHATITGNCESCHKSTANWLLVTFAHTPANAVGTGMCDTCHGTGGSATTEKNLATHIPIPAGTAKCDACHRSQASWATAVTMNHASVATATCKSCHDGRYLTQGVVGALAKPTNHIPEAQLLNGAAMDCKACHTGTTAWTTVRMNHNASRGIPENSGRCIGCHVSGTSFLGNMEKKALNHERAGSIDCSQSGCHRPIGNEGTAYSSW